MKLNRKIVPAVAALTAAALITTGCASGDGAPEQSLTYWSMWKQGEPQQKVLQSAIDSFTKETGIAVEVQWSGREVLQQVSARLSAGNPPDLFDGDGSEIVPQIGSVDGLEGLQTLFDEKIPGENTTISEVIPAAVIENYRTKDGQPAIAPYEITGSTLWYNGLSEPAVDPGAIGEWSGFLDDLEARKAAGHVPIALDGDIADYDAYWLIWSLLRRNGAGSFAAAATDETGQTWKQPSYVASFEPVLELIKSGMFPKDFMGTKFPAQQTEWAQSGPKAGYLLMGTWGPSETGSALEQAGEDVGSLIEYKSVPFPRFDGADQGAKVVQADATGFAIAKRARHKEAAKKFIAYFMNKDRLSQISSVAQNLTPRTDIPAPEALAGYAAEYTQEGAQYVLTNDGVTLTEPQWLTNVWQPAVTELFDGTYATASAFAERLAEKTASYYQNKG